MTTTRRRNPMDFTLLAVAMGLLGWGLVMVYSASAILAEQTVGDSLYFFKRQLVWAVIGLTAMLAASRTDYNRLKEWVRPILLVTALCLVAALFSRPIAGVRRWLRFGPIGLQPAEFAKLASVIFLAYYLDLRHSKTGGWRHGLAVPVAVVGVLLALILKSPDIGTPILMFGVMILVLFIGGSKVHYLLGLFALTLPLLVYEVIRKPYRVKRLMTFLSPFENAQGAGYQLSQSILAVGSGGWFGKGLGASKLKLMYLPTPHTDFIFPVICEELGLLGALAMLGLFATLLVRGVRIARSAPNLFGTLLAAGITFTICLQAFFNVGMAIGVLPTKGIPLPFVSFGGSSLLATLLGVGILLNISRQSRAELAA